MRKKLSVSIEDFFSKCDQIRKKLLILSHLQKKSLKEIFIFLCSENIKKGKEKKQQEEKNNNITASTITPVKRLKLNNSQTHNFPADVNSLKIR